MKATTITNCFIRFEFNTNIDNSSSFDPRGINIQVSKSGVKSTIGGRCFCRVLRVHHGLMWQALDKEHQQQLANQANYILSAGGEAGP
eukprot:4729393-Amphidinium_carterae.1